MIQQPNMGGLIISISISDLSAYVKVGTKSEDKEVCDFAGKKKKRKTPLRISRNYGTDSLLLPLKQKISGDCKILLYCWTPINTPGPPSSHSKTIHLKLHSPLHQWRFVNCSRSIFLIITK